MQIGNWVKRGRGKWHVVESIVAEDAVTRCGKRMADWPDSHGPGKLQVSALMPLTRMIGQPQLCKAGCEARESGDHHEPGILLEDDGSTAPTDTTDVP